MAHRNEKTLRPSDQGAVLSALGISLAWPVARLSVFIEAAVRPDAPRW
jgi:hypothetical protein